MLKFKLFLVACLTFLIVGLARAESSGPAVAKDPGTEQTVGTSGEIGIPGPNLKRIRWTVCCHAGNTADCRFRKAKTCTSTTGIVLAKGLCYTEDGPNVYTGPIAVASSSGTVTYFTQED